MPVFKHPYIRKKNMIMCANCGGLGHVYKNCNSPTISYGFICFKVVNDQSVYLMVQRKDSLSYVEFIRGKYKLENRLYIMKLFSNMTEEERHRIRNRDFETLWKEMWCKNEDECSKNFNREYNEASEKFYKLKKGYYIKSHDDASLVTLVNIDIFLTQTMSEQLETEWGFPKGRRNVNENDINCALREFKEETGFDLNSLEICSHMKPLEEVFSGTNKKRYKHVYYIARWHDEETGGKTDIPSCREIKDVRWFDYESAQLHIKDINVERKELLKRLNQILVKYLSHSGRHYHNE